MELGFNPYPKEYQLRNNRRKKTAKQRGNISTKTRQSVNDRSQMCEWCGWMPGLHDPTGRKWGIQKAHLTRRWKLDETTDKDVANLCGPSVNSETCHWKVDHTAEGRRWAAEYREKLRNQSIQEKR